MKNLWAVIIFVFSVPHATASTEKKVTEAFVHEYVKEQIKHEIEIYLNRHPGIVGSDNPQIGTLGINMVSKVLAANNLIQAHSDKERMWAASQLFLSPEPTTAIVLFAVQLADTMMSLRHAKSLAEIRLETEIINAQTGEILNRIALDEIGFQKRILRRFNNAIDEIEKSRKSLSESPVYIYLSSDSPGSAPEFKENEVADSLKMLQVLNYNLSDLENTAKYLKDFVKPEALNMPPDTVMTYLKLIDTHRPLQESVVRLQEAFNMFFSLIYAEKLNEQANRELESYGTDLRLFKRCFTYQDQNTVEGKSDGVLEFCRKRFLINNKGALNEMF